MAVNEIAIEGAAGGDPLEQLGFLLARHGAVANSRVQRAFGSCGLAPRAGATLMLLGGCGSMGQQGLVAALEVDPSIMVAILNDLESAQLVERRRDPADRRRHIVAITDRGRGVLAEARAAVDEVERGLFGDLSPEEIAALRGLLARVRTLPGDEVCSEG
ncbi:MarR family winged helix-turn-helix transcriptional regulator [Actinacidiphila glaucinigra]|uniref:MarR family winged helix-turn-helix transcriptional regulator n=1 Tax=Actinacidiphila glaucinigra TaxID=235986 RepID=UPI002DD8A5BB|nr:MarR family winged helix-turn-helix transcriptional regulator [Actinacidiphila glaucinigra]WSD58247.1 MarR family winged helix-turn-helix transcriptional regulator [Actinacidiphila glaucinigra]